LHTTTNFTSGGKTIQAELYNPSATPNGGVIVIAYGTDGMTDNLNGPWATMIRDYATKLSERGFVAIIPDYFASTGTQPGESALQGTPIHRDTWQETIADAVTHAKTLPGVDSSRVGLLGFSLGGHICLRLRAIAQVLVEFFAPEKVLIGFPPVLDGIGTTKTLSLYTQIHHGLGDKLVPFVPNADNIKQILETEKANVELFSYPGAVHGFVKDDSDNKNARDLAMKRTLSFFESHL
jgi:dienelactone hydrolase